MEKTLVAIFDDQNDAQQAFEALLDDGFSSSNVHLASAESLGASTAGTDTSRPDQEKSFGGKLANFFGFGDHDETYTEAVKRGSYVLTVDAASDDDAERAEDIINEYDSVDIDKREAEWRESGWQALQGKAGEPTMSIVEGQLEIGKRAAQKGGVRVVSRVTERPVDRAVVDSDTAFKESAFEVRGTAEEAVVGKTSRVVEEVVIGKESSTREQTIKDSVRKTDDDVEQLDQGVTGSRRELLHARSGIGRYSGAERRGNFGANYAGIERRA